MHFLIGLAIICVIFAIPELRAVALWLIGAVAFIVFAIILFGNNPVSQYSPPLSAEEVARREAARLQAAQRYEESKNLIRREEVDIRNIYLGGYPGSNQNNPNNGNNYMTLILKNLSLSRSLIELNIVTEFFDCPTNVLIINNQCDKFADASFNFNEEIPFQQIRRINSSNMVLLRNIPPMRGVFRMRYTVQNIRGA